MEKATKATLGLLLSSDDKVLMARKTRGDGAGNMNFPGGKPLPEEMADLRLCIARECQKEVGYVPRLKVLELVGKLRFYFANIFKCDAIVLIASGSSNNWSFKKSSRLSNLPPALIALLKSMMSENVSNFLI